MSHAKLLSISVERFKSHSTQTRLDFGLLNVIIGRNNSGKSSVIQALLLLKQTLEFPRLDVPLRLEGYVDAFSIRELTFGWPDSTDSFVLGPSFTIEWESQLSISKALANLGNPDISTLSTKAMLPWLLEMNLVGDDQPVTTQNSIRLNYGELRGKTILNSIELKATVCFNTQTTTTSFRIVRDNEGNLESYFANERAHQMVVSLEHFLPYLNIDRRHVGPRDRQRSWANAFHLLFDDSLEDLKLLIKGFSFLSSTRGLSPSLYRPSTEPIDNIGVSGEYAAQLLQSHKSDYVHYFLPDEADPGALPQFCEQTLVKAVNQVLQVLGVDSGVSIEEIKNAGFRLLFGKASMQHVGRGLTYLLPLVQLGLVSDPMRFKYRPSMGAADYEQLSYIPCAFEEPEAHLHPKVQSRLALWFVALAMGRRQVIVETHSDHLVRKLRSLVAKSPTDSPMERWLLANVRLATVEQKAGVSTLVSSALTKDGGLENWPTDFMDESTDVEQEIYFASLDKAPLEPSERPTDFIHHDSGAPLESDS
jgi:predicted ATPase